LNLGTAEFINRKDCARMAGLSPSCVITLALALLAAQSSQAETKYDTVGSNVCVTELQNTFVSGDQPRSYPDNWHPKSFQVKINRVSDSLFFWSRTYLKDGEPVEKAGLSQSAFRFDNDFDLSFSIDHLGAFKWVTFMVYDMDGKQRNGFAYSEGTCYNP
jgi:hypothetical protein